MAIMDGSAISINRSACSFRTASVPKVQTERRKISGYIRKAHLHFLKREYTLDGNRNRCTCSSSSLDL